MAVISTTLVAIFVLSFLPIQEYNYNKTMAKYIIKKEVVAKSIKEALSNEANGRIFEAFESEEDTETSKQIGFKK